jgi:hypothetical protein
MLYRLKFFTLYKFENTVDADRMVSWINNSSGGVIKLLVVLDAFNQLHFGSIRLCAESPVVYSPRKAYLLLPYRLIGINFERFF